MIKKHLPKLKKYVFLISLFTLFVTFSHILYRYVVYDAKSLPIKWWNVSEAIVWEVSHLNPLISTSDYNKYIISILYRSLLKYDVNEKKVVSDLATCDISNLAYIECSLEPNIFWSNKKPIITKDIVSTYNILKTTNVNPVVKSLLADTTITEKNNSIIFKNTKKNINFINVFFQPILNDELINDLWVNELAKPFTPTKESLYSWKYKVSALKEDKNLWIIDLVLEKNDNYFNNNVYIDKIIFKFFKNNSFVIKNKDLINIFNDDENIIWKSVPRLQSNYYTLPKYTTIFLNSEKLISKSLRNFILNKIDREKLIKLLWKEKYKEIYNPYLTQYSIDKNIENKNIESIMESNWFYKKSELAKLILWKNEIKSTSWNIDNVSEGRWVTINDIENKENTSLNFIESWLTKKYNFISEDDILLKWSLKWENPTAVYIDDYKLKWYKVWDLYFYYRLKVLSYETIKEWKNVYKIYFEKNWKKVLKEEIIVFYYNDISKLEIEKNKFYEWFIKKEVATNTKPIKEKKTDIDPEIIKKMDVIDDKYFYNKKLEKYTLKLIYIWSEVDLENTSDFIKTTLWEYWIDVIIKSIWLEDVSKFTSSWDHFNNYDMVLAWINLWYFDFNIYPYFHSSQAKLGYNFSNIKKLSLDIILEEINSNNINKNTLKEKQDKALKIIKEEQTIKTLYTPVFNLLIDKNIKSIDNKNKNFTFSWQIDRVKFISDIYINEKKEIKYRNKWPFDFIKFLFRIITW